MTEEGRQLEGMFLTVLQNRRRNSRRTRVDRFEPFECVLICESGERKIRADPDHSGVGGRRAARHCRARRTAGTLDTTKIPVTVWTHGNI